MSTALRASRHLPLLVASCGSSFLLDQECDLSLRDPFSSRMFCQCNDDRWKVGSRERYLQGLEAKHCQTICPGRLVGLSPVLEDCDIAYKAAAAFA